MLGQRNDRDQRLKCLRQLPRAVKLLGMQTRPLTGQPQRPTRELAVQDLQRSKLDLREMLALLGMKVRRWMIGPVHVDHDPVERRQPRHSPVVDDAPAGAGDTAE
jgi:hypothetical protein